MSPEATKQASPVGSFPQVVIRKPLQARSRLRGEILVQLSADRGCNAPLWNSDDGSIAVGKYSGRKMIGGLSINTGPCEAPKGEAFDRAFENALAAYLKSEVPF